ncbi:MAG: iron chelate uptake ABC transporter family permease subunit, partial [Bifidobacteriaceae bacterium]|nr:iron chelate uptake ABC transporter family permease subunit [Bifidobacteriaceae bacterium]
MPLRLILAGIGLGFLAQATTQYLLTRMDVHEAGTVLAWLVGSTAGRTWTRVAVTATALAGRPADQRVRDHAWDLGADRRVPRHPGHGHGRGRDRI